MNNGDKTIKKVLEYAIFAPSGHNSQPWKFLIKKNQLTILPDFSRIRTMVDPEKRELFISLGAVTKNVELAAKNFALDYEYKIVGDKIVFEFKKSLDKVKTNDLFEAIKERRTYREEFKEVKVENSKIEKIYKTSGVNCWIETVDSKQKEVVAKLIWQSDLIWFKSRDLINELQEWMRDDIEENNDGLSTAMINMYKVAAELKYLFSKDAEKYKTAAKNNYSLAIHSPVIILVVSKEDNIENWIEAGRLYQTIGLMLVNLGLTNGLFNSAIELNGQRKKLSKIIKTKGYAQMLMRIGYPKMKVKATPRRSVEECLVLT